MARHSGPAQRNLFPGHKGAGKGDQDRSPGWRKHYDDIDWSGSSGGFSRIGKKEVKRYGQAEPEKLGSGPSIKVL